MKIFNQKTVVANMNNPALGAIFGKKCYVLEEFQYSGETWYTLDASDNHKIFNSPAQLWDEI